MADSRQRDQSYSKALSRKGKWRAAAAFLIQARRSTSLSWAVVLSATKFSVKHKQEVRRYHMRVWSISWANFSFNVNALTDYMSLSLSRSRKCGVTCTVDAIGRPNGCIHTQSSSYKFTLLLVTRVILYSLRSSERWTEMELLLWRHAPKISEVVREGLYKFINLH